MDVVRLAVDSSFSSFCFARLVLELLVLVVALDATRRFEFPFIAAIAVFVGWFFVIDLLSSGGNWTAWVTLFVGLVYFAAGAAMRLAVVVLAPPRRRAADRRLAALLVALEHVRLDPDRARRR